MLTNEIQDAYNQDIIINISNCINDKLTMLNIKLPQFAELSEVDYFSLRKLMNHEPNYMPNLRMIIKIATYLNIKVGDLLDYNNLPQYIPIISKKEIVKFLDNHDNYIGFNNKVFSEHFIHNDAFAIKEESLDLLLPSNVIYICYPTKHKTLTENQIYLFSIIKEKELEYIFGRIITTTEDKIQIKIKNQQQEWLSQYEVIATVVSIQMHETFL